MEINRERVNPSTFSEYLKKYIGKKVNIEFLIGTNKLVHKTGTLKEVGSDHVVFVNPNGISTIADLFSIKFVDILN